MTDTRARARGLAATGLADPAARLRLLLDRGKTPIGEMIIVADEEGRLRAVHWTDREPTLTLLLERQFGASGFTLSEARDPGGIMSAMSAYFEGELAAIDRIAVQAIGTPFQREVWTALREIPYGTTVSYGELARRIARPAAVRAVGLANGANPISIVVPCHRVIGSNGTLTGYGGGLERKRWLLTHEGASTRVGLLFD